MITIIEGADATGKSTYAHRLAERTGRQYVHKGAPEPGVSWQEEYLRPLERGDRKVLDRWHLGELVWSEVFGRPSLFQWEWSFSNCNKALWLLGVREVLVVVRDEDGIRRTLAERGEEEQTRLVLEGQRVFRHVANRITSIPTTVVHSDVLHRRTLANVR